MFPRPSLLALLSLLIAVPSFAATDSAPTPPMGWNSWDSYGLTVTEAEYRANVSWLHQHLQRLLILLAKIRTAAVAGKQF